MNYQQTTNKSIVSYHSLKGIYPNSILAEDGTEIIIDYHVIATTAKPPYDIYTQNCIETEPVNYTQTWSIVDMTQQEIDDNDVTLRSNYETSMNRDMITAQVDALGDPALHRYSQGMSRYSTIVALVATGGTPTQEEIDFMAGSDAGLQYQETNAFNFAGAVTSIASLSGQAILDHPVPDFTMNPATHSIYQPYLDYLESGYVELV